MNDGAPTPLPLSELAPPPNSDAIFAELAELKDKHERELQEYQKAQVSSVDGLDDVVMWCVWRKGG